MTIKLEGEELIKIRLACTEDAQAIAQLSEQLGYPVSQQAMQQRLKRIQQDEGHAVYVAEHLDGIVVGWVHVYACQLVVTERQAMILGLIVDERQRHRGIGQRLIHCVEEWAREREC